MMSNICSLSMDNTHNNDEFGMLQKTSKQSLISSECSTNVEIKPVENCLIFMVSFSTSI